MIEGSAGSRPLVSVALATYNGGRYLREQLDSIYGQTCRNIEVVVFDDCSIDDTVSILEEYGDRFGLRYEVNECNLGFARNFEKVLTQCRGEFVALADQDDIWLPQKLEMLLSGIKDVSLVYSDAFLVDEAGGELPGSLIGVSGVRPLSGRHFDYFVCNTCVTGCTCLFRRDLLSRALPIPSCETYHDWWLGVVASCERGVGFIDLRLVKYRQHGANETGANIKTGIITRIIAHLRGDTDSEKRKYYELLRARAKTYPLIRERLSLEVAQLQFLADIGSYAESLLEPRFRWRSFFLALRYRHVLFPAAGALEKCVFVFSKLINKIVCKVNA